MLNLDHDQNYMYISRPPTEVDPEKAKLRAQLEADKLERAAREPVTQSAMAKQVGGQPPTIRSGRDIGC